MKNKLHKRTWLLAAFGILCTILLGAFLLIMQTQLSIANQSGNTKKNVDQIQTLVDSAYASAKQNQESYDEVYQSKAATVAYMAKKDTRFSNTDTYLKKLAGKMNVSNILIVDREGAVVSKAAPTQSDFTLERYNQLRTVFDDNQPSQAFEVTIGEQTRRYFGAKIDGTHQVVIEHDPAELHQTQASIDSWASILDSVKVGTGGYAFAVSSQDYTFLYHPNESLLGQDSLNAGLDVESLEDNYYGWLTLNGERLYSGVKKLEGHNAYVVCAVPESELTASRNITVGIVLFTFFVILTLIISYAYFLYSDSGEKENDEKNYALLFKKIRYNKVIGRKLVTISALGLFLIFIVSFYMQTLFSMSQISLSNKHLAEEVTINIENNEKEIQLLTEQYNRRYLNKGQIAADILSGNPQLHTKEDLAELSQVLGVEFLLIFDKNGRETVSDSSYVNFQIGTDPADQSYEFGKLLQGLEYVIQAPQPDEVSGKYRQYIGCLMYDPEGNTDGFLQLSVYPEKLKAALEATELSKVLGGIKPSGGGFAFAVEKANRTFSWFPEEHVIGKDAIAYGMEEKQLRNGYSDYIVLNNQRYYGASLETAEDYIYVAVPESKVTGTRLPMALYGTGASLILLLAFLLLLPLVYIVKEEVDSESETGIDPMVDVKMPDGRIRKTESAANRWANSSIKWDEKTPEQRVAMILKTLLSLFALVICAAVLFKDSLFSSDSIILYIISGQWERGVNIFSISGCIMIICVVKVAVMALMEVLRMLSKMLDARGETICRLIQNFTKYISVIAILYYCFALFGVDTKTLLASAGILSLVIGLGAKTLVSDILAGLFIIFEGEFRVGDIVTIGDWRGTVQEIGVRTTKIMDGGQNVKIISNSDVNGVINMTKRNSYTFCDVGIEYGESLERVENILAKELPNIKKRLPAIKDGPVYKGVVSLGDNSVNIRIASQCKESDRAQLSRDMNREMKLLFDKYDINIPFPQVVLNEAKEYTKATESEKRKADAFNEEQKELSKEMGLGER